MILGIVLALMVGYMIYLKNQINELISIINELSSQLVNAGLAKYVDATDDSDDDERKY